MRDPQKRYKVDDLDAEYPLITLPALLAMYFMGGFFTALLMLALLEG